MFEEFHAQSDRSLPVFVSRTVANTPAERERFGELKKFIEAGGTAVYLQGRRAERSVGQSRERIAPAAGQGALIKEPWATGCAYLDS